MTMFQSVMQQKFNMFWFTTESGKQSERSVCSVHTLLLFSSFLIGACNIMHFDFNKLQRQNSFFASKLEP